MMPENSRLTRTSHRSESLWRRVADLKRERAELEEEVLQLRAAAQVWTEICRRVMYTAGVESIHGEMR